MKFSVEDKQGLFKSLRVEVEGEIVKSALSEVYEHLRQHAEVEGFRRGKAPIWILRSKFKDYIEEEVGKRVANATLESAIKESGLKPVADVYLEEVKLQELEQKVNYSVSFEVPPEFDLANLEGLEVEVKKIEFSEDLVKKRIEELREEHIVWEPVEREVREGDLVVVDYKVEDLESGETTEGETSNILGQKVFREEIERGLLGKREGDSLLLEELILYDVEGKPAGKAKVEIRVKGVKEKRLPELSDDFAKELALGETWAEAEEKIREQVKADLKNTKKALVEDAVVRRLLELHNFEIPQTLLQRELSHLVQLRATSLSQWGIDQKYIDYRALAQELAPQAISNIKIRYILDKYAQKKGIQIEEGEKEKKIEELAQQYGKPPQEIKDYLQRENLLHVIEEDIKREKALEGIVSKVVVKEKEEKDEDT
ncbi:MAG: trigger factor [Aquificaceae bacterium]